MEFCSKYGYDYGFQGSDSEEISDEEGETQVKTTRRFRRADTNIIAVKFDSLTRARNAHSTTSKPITCTNCTACLSVLSEPNISKETAKWTCEFCQTENTIELASLDREAYMLADVTYVLEAAPVVEKTAKTDEKVVSTDDNYLTFCIDVSGSMDTNIEGKMTRLDGIKLACVENVKKLRVEEPNKRVGLVTFSEDVKFFGDCKKSKPIVDTAKGRSNCGYSAYQQKGNSKKR